jgi:hypothetical protein
MRSTRLIAVLLALAAVSVFTNEASAMLNAQLGRFMQRDPGPNAGRSARTGVAGPATGGGFAQRDPMPAGPTRIGAAGIAVGAVYAPQDRAPVGSARTRTSLPSHTTRQPGAPVGTSIHPSSVVHNQYVDGMNLYQYVGSNPLIHVDPEGLCKKKLKKKGHGLFLEDAGKKDIAKGKQVPVGMTNGIYSDELLQKHHIAKNCDELCNCATLELHACGIGHNEDYMKELASGCPDKFTKVCGYLKKLKYIPWTNITLAAPWGWKCLELQ